MDFMTFHISKMKRLSLICAFILSLYFVQAQEMSVQHFYLAEMDLTANTPGTMVEDQNGNVCALIKLETTIDGFSFDVGSLGVSQVKREGGEIWVYVPFGVRKITLSHPQFGVIRDYAFPCPIEKGRTYILKLNAASAALKHDSSKKKMVRIQINPADAVLEINGIPMQTNSQGVFAQELSYGHYEIEVTSKRYHPEHRHIDVGDHGTIDEVIKLKQAYGWLNVTRSGDERLYIDGTPVTYYSGQNIELMSGNHKIRLEKPLYKPYEQVVTIKDSVVMAVSPTFAVNYRELEFRVGTASEIWIDGRKVNEGTGYIGKLEYGEHTIECRKPSHRSTTKVLNVTSHTTGPVNLDAPVPIYGTLVVNSDPSGSEVYVDGSYVGNTPYTSKVLIGQKKVSVKRKGYDTIDKSVMIQEGQTARLNEKLNNLVTLSISSDPNADLYINNTKAGRTPYAGVLLAGTYDIRLQAYGHHDLTKKITIDHQHDKYYFRMKRQYYYKDDFVFGANVSTNLNDLRVGGYAGVYLNGLYLEGSYMYGLNESEDIYWYDKLSENEAVAYSYRPMTIGGKLGYGMILGTRLRITPYAGVGFVLLNGKLVRDSSSEFSARSCYAVSVAGGVRFSCALTSCVDLNITPEYHYFVHKTDMYNILYDVSSAIRSWDESFRLNVGLGFFF